MKAAIYYGQADIRVERWPDPTPGPDEVVLEVHAAGICGTDASEYAEGPVQYPIETRHPVTGHLGPMIPGHELCGRVVGRGPLVTGISEGDLVVSGAGISLFHLSTVPLRTDQSLYPVRNDRPPAARRPGPVLRGAGRDVRPD